MDTVSGRVPTAPGSQGSTPQPAAPSSPIGADPSRVNAVYYEHAKRGIAEMFETLRKQIFNEAMEIARIAQHPRSAGYLASRTAQLHDWATRLSAYRSIQDGWFRDTDGSPEGTDAQRQDGEAATAGAEGIAQGLVSPPDTDRGG